MLRQGKARKKEAQAVGLRFLFQTTQLLSGIHAEPASILAELSKRSTADLGEQSVVAADTDVDAGMDVGAALANKNVARENELTVGALGPRRLDLESRPFLVEPIPFL